MSSFYSGYLDSGFYLFLNDSIDFPFCCLEPPFDLNLYRFNIDSLKLYEIAKFYTRLIPLLKYKYELTGYFPAESILKIDSLKKLIYYDVISLMIDPDIDEHEYEGTICVNLNNRKTFLGKLVTFKQNKSIGKN